VGKLIEYQLAEGEKVVVEVADEGADEGLRPAGRGPAIAATTFEGALDAVMPAARSAVHRLKALAPDELALEFGIKFNTKAGAVIASTALEANLKVTLTWSPGARRTAGATE
jgi:hypothetical protein